MQIILAKSCKDLFFKCIILQIVVNTLFYLINISISQDFTIILISGTLQIVFSLLGGLYIRKNNKALLMEEGQKRKLYAKISLVGLLVLLTFFFVPDIISMPYMYVLIFFYETFGIDRILTGFDFFSIFICLCSVFLLHKNEE